MFEKFNFLGHDLRLIIYCKDYFFDSDLGKSFYLVAKDWLVRKIY